RPPLCPYTTLFRSSPPLRLRHFPGRRRPSRRTQLRNRPRHRGQIVRPRVVVHLPRALHRNGLLPTRGHHGTTLKPPDYILTRFAAHAVRRVRYFLTAQNRAHEPVSQF